MTYFNDPQKEILFITHHFGLILCFFSDVLGKVNSISTSKYSLLTNAQVQAYIYIAYFQSVPAKNKLKNKAAKEKSIELKETQFFMHETLFMMLLFSTIGIYLLSICS